ncbi:mitogen-activated protein kinase kinase kinase A-like [Lineus longissimus]|uniref:mitogen-activated protein kinase kinase kinase A-like n=1 Tax=Lineus longissimus TaxID=88925 RepID=UPI002B4E603D
MAQPNANIDIEKYEKVKDLGKGQFGEVLLYQLKQGVDNGISHMAVKQAVCPDATITASICREVDILCQLTHPNIVQYLGHHVNGSFIQIMLQYMSGGSVDYLLDKTAAPFSEERTKRYTRDVMEGLRYLHGLKIIHRDIKGGNILLDGVDSAKLADFGLSKIMETSKSAHTYAGTPLFMSPEMILTSLEDSGHGLKTDIWSTGCVVVQMLSSDPPWKAKCLAGISRFILMRDIAQCERPDYTLPDGVSQIARDFLNHCFVKEPKDRPSADDLLRHAFLA